MSQTVAQTADTHPFETRDQNLLNLIHGQALPTDATLMAKSQSQWSGSLIITNTTNIKSNRDESIYLDYEAYRFNLSYQYGLNADWNLKLDIPLIHQSGGIFDSSIDNWHGFFGLPRGQRPQVQHDQYRVQYIDQQQTLLDLDQDSTTLGDIQLAAARSLVENSDTTMSLWAAIKLPTGDEQKLTGNGATDISAWLALDQRLGSDWSLNLNAGSVILGKDSYQDIALADQVFYGHIMLGWLMTERVNLKLQLQGHTSYYENSNLNILGDTYLLTFGTTIATGSCQQLDVAISEDIKVSASPDISLLLNWRLYTGHDDHGSEGC